MIEIVLLRNHSDQRSNLASSRANVTAFNEELTGTAGRAAGNHAHRCRLTRAVRPEQAKRFSATYCKVDRVDRALLAINFREGPRLDYDRRNRRVLGFGF